MKTILALLLTVFLGLLALPALADNHSTLRVVVVDTDDVGAYVAELAKGKFPPSGEIGDVDEGCSP